jgi:hypothetical protein
LPKPDVLDLPRAERMRLPNSQLSTTAISLRLPVRLLGQIKIAAHKCHVRYQSLTKLIKMWLRGEGGAGGRASREASQYMNTGRSRRRHGIGP